MWRAEEMISIIYGNIENTNISFHQVVSSQGKKIGQGDFGITYLYKNKAVKFVKIQNPTHLESELNSINLNREAQVLQYNANGKVPCVCPILEWGTEEDYDKDTKYLWSTMPSLTPFVHSLENLKLVFEACRILVENGFLHNDFHMGNVMSYNGNPIIIDLGLMRKTEVLPLFVDPLFVDILTFAQIATFLDNCNSNTKCMKFVSEPAFEKYRKATSEFFKRVPLKNGTAIHTSKQIIKHLNQEYPQLSAEVQLQFVVAKLSHDYFSKEQTCGFLENSSWCNKPKGKSVADIIYAIRNPSSIDKKLLEVFKMLKDGI
tara:strand:- start:3380 stop:4330 length:951 start_codon:yes stop_codon:yes gene_type:complete